MDEEVRNEQETTGQNSTQTGANSGATDSGTSAGSSTSATTDELLEEINRLGARFAAVVQTAWNSEERKKIEADLKKGAASLSATIEESFQKVSDNEKTRTVVDQADDVMTNVGNKVRSSEVTQDLSTSLARGLRMLSDRLEKWVADLDTGPQSGATAQADDDDSQEIPIDKA